MMAKVSKDLVKRQKEALKQTQEMNENLQQQMNDNRKQARKRTSKTGRSKGDKNTRYDDVNQVYVNQWGVEITKSEREQLRQAVNSVKRKQKRILTDTTGKYDTVKLFYSDKGEFRGMLQELSTSVNQFKTRKQFEHYMSNLGRWKSRGYETKQMQQVKDNYIKSLEPTFKYEYPEFLDHLKRMSLSEFFQRRSDDLFTDFAYMNSDMQDTEDMYVGQLIHSFGYLTPEEKLNGDSYLDRMTGEKITVKALEKKQKVAKKRTKKK